MKNHHLHLFIIKDLLDSRDTSKMERFFAHLFEAEDFNYIAFSERKDSNIFICCFEEDKINLLEKELWSHNLLLKSEGGWVNHPSDPGGETNLGVTKRVWEEWVGHPVESLKNLTKDQVAPLYEQKYWRPCYGEVLPRGLDFLVFSTAVNCGTGRSVKLLQQSLGCVADGAIGPKTRELISSSDVSKLIAKFSETRREFYRSLNKPAFEKGWLSRVDKEEKEALDMAKNG